MARRRKASGSKRRRGSSNALLAGLVVAGGIGVLYLALKPSTASAATVPPLPRPAVAPAPPPVRTSTTRSKPNMPSDLQTLLNSSDDAKIIFWELAALYNLDPTAGVPTKARVEYRLTNGTFDAQANSTFRSLGATNSGSLGNLEFLYGRVKGIRFDLPYQVPTAIWNWINSYFRTLFDEDAPSSVEPK